MLKVIILLKKSIFYKWLYMCRWIVYSEDKRYSKQIEKDKMLNDKK